MKRESFFNENFIVKFKAATLQDLNDVFMPIYSVEVMSREGYTLNRENIFKEIALKVKNGDGRYNFLFIYDKNNSLMGATLFSLTENRLGMAFRAYTRNVSAGLLKHKASLDYWGEKLLRDYAKQKSVQVFSHGKDSHPYIGRKRIGLSLYKMKTGTRPKVLDAGKIPFKTKTFSEDFFLSQSEPSVFFTEPGEENFYSKGFLYYPQNSLHESLINEFKKVADWSGIFFETIAYPAKI